MAVAIAAVVVLVAGAEPTDPTSDTSTVAVAGALGGPNFAQDVAAAQAKASLAKVISAIQNGQIPLPNGLTQEQALAVLNTTLQRHMIAPN